jgi:Ala-tRNA(Pro) deacylase
MNTTQEFLKYLAANDVDYRIFKHDKALTIHHLAQEIHLPIHFIVRFTLIRIDGYCWMIVLPAVRRVNFNAICRALDAINIREEHENDWSFLLPDCEISTIPPFGNLYGFRVIADTSFQEGKWMIFNAFSPTQSVFMRWEDYARLVQPVIADISKALPMSEYQQRQADVSTIHELTDHAIFSQRQFELDGFFNDPQKKS